MKIKKIILIVVTLSTGIFHSVFGQQTPVFANYSYNNVVINPAHAGYYPDTDITVTNRGHLNSIEGSPKNIGLTVNFPANFKNVGMGAGISNDRVGVTNITSLFGAYSYKIFFNSDTTTWWDHNPHVLSFGITGGATFYNENLLDLEINNDPNFANNISTIIPTIGVGVFYNRERIYVGFSIPNLLGNSLSSDDNININSTYYFNTGYRFFATRFQEIMINPSILIKYVSGAPVQADLNTKINYKNKYEFGVGYRTNSSVNILAGFHLSKRFRILYNYNKNINNTTMDTHGIVLNLRLGKGFGGR